MAEDINKPETAKDKRDLARGAEAAGVEEATARGIKNARNLGYFSAVAREQSGGIDITSEGLKKADLKLTPEVTVTPEGKVSVGARPASGTKK